jgi:hypothetical protein
MVKSLLLGSAAGVVAIAGAQAADLPVKAKPVEYVKVCSLYGAGFWYVPGTNTCVKLGSYIRYQMEHEANGGFIYRNGANARYTRTDQADFTSRIRGVISMDTRTQTDYGTLRGYVRIGAEQTQPTDTAEVAFMDRAFIQFGGLTAGRADSFFDFFSLARYNYINNFISSNMGATGQQVLGYTFQFGNGLSATLAIEDGGSRESGINASSTRTRGRQVTDLNQAGGLVATATGASVLDNGPAAMPDVVGNVRVDQAWGSAQIMGALHQNRAGYYNAVAGGAGCPVGTAAGLLGTEACGYPGDKLGWAVGAGIVFNNVFGLQGDSISAQVNYGQGAAGYVQRGIGAYTIFGSGRSVGVGAALDSVFGCTATACSALEQVESWGFTAGAEHRWNPQWRTSVYGGYVEHNYSGGGRGLICSTVAATGAGTPLGTDIALAAGSNCNPDFSMWNVGTRTQWNPHPYLDIGVDVMYYKLNTAFAGSTATLPGPIGGRTGGAGYRIEDQDILSVFGRIQYNFLP